MGDGRRFQRLILHEQVSEQELPLLSLAVERVHS